MKGHIMKTSEINVNNSEIVIYNHEETVQAIKDDLEYIRKKSAEYAIRIGRRLIDAKENVPHGKWLETLEEVGFSPDTAERLMKISKAFGDNPELLEGMTQQKALIMASLPENNLIQLKDDEVFIASNGTVYTLSDIREMTGKNFQNELLNLRNQKNKEIREVRGQVEIYGAEMKSMTVQAKEQQAFMEKLMKDSNEALADEIDRLKKLLSSKNGELDSLKLEIQKNEEEQVEGEEALSILFEIRTEFIGIFSKLNRINLVKGEDVRARYFELITWVREYMNSKHRRLNACLDKLEEYDGNESEDIG